MHTSKFLLNENLARRGSRNKFSRSIPFILSVVLMLTVGSCGGTTNNTGSPIAIPGGPYLGNANQALTFNGSASSAPSGRTLTSYAWLFGDGASGTGATTSHTYTVAGNYTATLTVTDSSGATNASNVAVQIITAPVAKPGGPYNGKVGVAVSFNGSASTAPPGQALGFSWNFGDGSSLGTGATPTHTYGSVCTCTVTLTVTDDTAGTSFATTTATISAGPEPSGQTASPSTLFAIGPAADPSSQFAYILTTSRDAPPSVTVKTIDTVTGALLPTNVAPPSLGGLSDLIGIVPDPARKSLVLYSPDGVESFGLDPSGRAFKQTGLFGQSRGTDGVGSQSLVFDPAGKVAFYISETGDGSGVITRCSVNPNSGGLSPREVVFAPVQNPNSAVIGSSGKYLYVSGTGPDDSSDPAFDAPSFAAFSIDPQNNRLSPILAPSFSTQPRISISTMVSSANGKFIYALGNSPSMGSIALSTFVVNGTTGTLEELPTSPVSLNISGAGAASIALSPSGGFAYVSTIANSDDSTAQESVRIFSLDAQSGAPALIATLPTRTVSTGSGPLKVSPIVPFPPNQVNAANAQFKIVPGSIFLYLVSPVDGAISVFSADPISGLLTMHSTSVSSSGH